MGTTRLARSSVKGVISDRAVAAAEFAGEVAAVTFRYNRHTTGSCTTCYGTGIEIARGNSGIVGIEARFTRSRWIDTISREAACSLVFSGIGIEIARKIIFSTILAISIEVIVVFIAWTVRVVVAFEHNISALSASHLASRVNCQMEKRWWYDVVR